MAKTSIDVTPMLKETYGGKDMPAKSRRQRSTKT